MTRRRRRRRRRELTAKQRQAIECFEAARSEGMRLSAYVRSRGLGVREVYAAIAALRRKGTLPAAVPRTKKPFVAVRVAASAARASNDATGVELEQHRFTGPSAAMWLSSRSRASS